MPLPLREYYTIDRASELLGCTIDDLIHWSMVGCIRIYIKVDHAYGVVDCQHLIDLVGSGDFSEVMEGTEYKNKLSELDAMADTDDESKVDVSDVDYYIQRGRIVYHAMNNYIYSKGDAKCLDDVGMRYIYSNLHYHFGSEVTEDFSLIRSVDFICKSLKYDISAHHKILNKVEDEERKNVVLMQGFFGLGNEFFYNYNFRRKFEVSIGGGYDNDDGDNPVHMPESDLCIRMMSDYEVDLANEMMYIMKSDFIAIKEALKDGSELPKKYPYHRISNNHGWWKYSISNSFDDDSQRKDSERKSERVSRPAIAALNVLISKYHREISKSPTKIAEVLTAEAKEMGLDGMTFDKNTVSRWIKHTYQ